ncbi:MAG: OmpH family outer membrane protein [Bacteroidaceae bacterium]|nr:OmpH family outer membrane protein [Bacteroidaceae bacterium]
MQKLFIIAAAAAVLAGCNKQQASQTSAAAETTETAPSATGRIAYVEVDTLMTQYQFAKDFTIVLTKKGENIQTTLASKERELQQQAAAMQKKYESGGFASSAELQAAQQELATRQQNLQALGERLSADFAQEQAKYNNALRDSIQSYIRVYNKDKKYDLILSRAGDNLLYANPHLDITAEIVEGLNKNYKAPKELTEKIADQK